MTWWQWYWRWRRSCCSGSFLQQQHCLMRESVWLQGLYYRSLWVQFSPSKLYFNGYKAWFAFLTVGFYGLADQVLIMEVLLQVLIDAVTVGVEDFSNVIQLVTNAGRQLCLICGEGVCCILHISSSALEQACVDCLLVLKFLNLGEGGILLLLQVLYLSSEALEFCVTLGGAFAQYCGFAFEVLWQKLP